VPLSLLVSCFTSTQRHEGHGVRPVDVLLKGLGFRV